MAKVEGAEVLSSFGDAEQVTNQRFLESAVALQERHLAKLAE